MKSSESMVIIYKALKKLAPKRNAAEDVANLVHNAFFKLQEMGLPLTAKNLDSVLQEEAKFAQLCMKKKKKAA